MLYLSYVFVSEEFVLESKQTVCLCERELEPTEISNNKFIAMRFLSVR